ncbi:MAG: chlorophyll synthesis pathway protein BchC [Pseudohongiellaceae bacterium]|jgi:3-hydroxyethyl bacteriochlorophyllide a dehydrogenase
MKTSAVILEKPGRAALSSIELTEPAVGDLIVQVDWSGISTGTERLFWSGRMPDFPGMGYPLVPGYESVGRVIAAGPATSIPVGQYVFVPGANCFGEIRALFGGAAARLVVPEHRVAPIDEGLGASGVLLALAATALHAIQARGAEPPELIVGHGVLGRLMARLTVATGHAAPVVWETNPARHHGASGYPVVFPGDDPRRDYRSVYDVSGDESLLDTLISRLGRGGEVVLAGFYSEPLSFIFPPAFMREARIRIAAEWQPADLAAVSRLVSEGTVSLHDLVTHQEKAEVPNHAYRTAFTDSNCLKMILDWRGCA